MTKAYGIFSGGLDSILAARLLMEQGIRPTLITFVSPFFSPENAIESAAALGLEPRLVDICDELMELVKNPKHGRGRNLNPCIDCHALMFRRAAAILEEEGGEGFLFSGEVLGQRPLSQNRGALDVVSKNSGSRELILRPLSAKLLPPTLAEERGWVDRQKLLGFSGRGRTAQIKLAETFGITKFPAPAGGCLLTDPAFSRRLAWLLDGPRAAEKGWPNRRLLELLKCGRVFSAAPQSFVVVGRKEADNKLIHSLAAPGDLSFHLEGRPGPTVLWPFGGREIAPAEEDLAARLAAAYGDAKGETRAGVRVESPGREARFVECDVLSAADLSAFMIPQS